MRRAVVARLARHEEGVMLLPGGVFRRDVQRVEVVPVGLDLRTFGHRESHIGEDRGDFLRDLRHRMDSPLPPGPPRQRHVEPLGLQPLVQCRIAEGRLLRAQRGVDLILQPVERSPRRLPHRRLHLPQLAHLQRNLALLAKGRHAQLFQRGLVGRGADAGQVARLEGIQSVHRGLRGFPRLCVAAGPGECKTERRSARGRPKGC